MSRGYQRSEHRKAQRADCEAKPTIELSTLKACQQAGDEAAALHGGQKNYSTLNICETVQNE